MDWMTVSSRGMELVKRYRYMLLVILAGIILLRVPASTASSKPSAEPVQESEEESFEAHLEHILSLISGAGKVEVLLSQAQGEQILYQTDEDRSASGENQQLRTDTVLISGEGRLETGLIRQKNPPVYQGAIVLCQGADNAGIRLSVVEAVMDATGLTSDRITVLKMK